MVISAYREGQPGYYRKRPRAQPRSELPRLRARVPCGGPRRPGRGQAAALPQPRRPQVQGKQHAWGWDGGGRAGLHSCRRPARGGGGAGSHTEIPADHHAALHPDRQCRGSHSTGEDPPQEQGACVFVTARWLAKVACPSAPRRRDRPARPPAALYHSRQGRAAAVAALPCSEFSLQGLGTNWRSRGLPGLASAQRGGRHII